MIRDIFKTILKKQGPGAQTRLHEKTGIRKAAISGFNGNKGIGYDNLELIMKAFDIIAVHLSISEKVILHNALRPLFDAKHTGMISSRLIVGLYESFKLGEDSIITIKNDYWDAFGEEYRND